MPWPETEIQRHLTIDLINKRKLNAAAIWLKPESASPEAEDALRAGAALNCIPEDWRSPSEERNLGVRLADGFIELKIKSPDDVWLHCLFDACRSLNIDARAAFGVKGRPISSMILHVNDGPAGIERWRERWPRGHKDKTGQWVEAPFAYSTAPTKTGKVEWVDSAPLPGSRFMGALVVWRPWGKKQAENIELGLEDLESHREIAATNLESICRAIAFATLAYWIDVYLDGLEDWDEILTRTIGGWIARQIREGRAINATGKSLEKFCWSPIDSMDTALTLIKFLADIGAPKELGVTFARADAALERNSDAPVPGWNAIETMFGVQARIGIRRAFRAGLDLDVIERMSQQYAYDRMAHSYLDRDALLKGLAYEHKLDDLTRDYDNDPTFDRNGKPHNPFRLYATSSLRTDVHHREFRPGHEPGGILRYSPLHGILNGEDYHPDEYKLFNVFPGFTIKPIATIEQAIMERAVSLLDRMLGLLTRDNDAQMWWLKKFLAFIVQFPAIKCQVCPIIVGGQGIGKSLFGGNLMRALFGSMAGNATASVLTENKFMITPFLGKLITFIDEVKLESVGAINIIKNLVRSDVISGEKKFHDQRDYYVPSRLLIASNQADIGLTPEDAADRAFFFIISWNAENKKMTDREFNTWTLTLKPFYDEFMQALEAVVFRQHLMRYFTDVEVTRSELEDLKHSSRDDENVVRSTMSKAREVARHIVADARVNTGQDITAWFTSHHLRDAIKRWDDRRAKAEVSQVLMEFERAGVLEKMIGDYYRFKYGYGRLLEKMSEAHGLKIEPMWPVDPVGADWQDNEVMSQFGGNPWRGNKQQQGQRRKDYNPRDYDPDYAPDF